MNYRFVIPRSSRGQALNLFQGLANNQTLLFFYRFWQQKRYKTASQIQKPRLQTLGLLSGACGAPAASALVKHILGSQGINQVFVVGFLSGWGEADSLCEEFLFGSLA